MRHAVRWRSHDESRARLFHARFGGQVYPFEISLYTEVPRPPYDESELDGIRDPSDEAVYAAALARFEAEWAAHPEAEECMTSVRGAAAALRG